MTIKNECELLKYFMERLSGLESSKAAFFKFLMNGAWYTKNGGFDAISTSDLKEANFPYHVRDFLGDELPEIWLKSIKYDAILEELQGSASEEIKDKSQIDKIKAIVDEKK